MGRDCSGMNCQWDMDGRCLLSEHYPVEYCLSNFKNSMPKQESDKEISENK
jgi:hypothetical protein